MVRLKRIILTACFLLCCLSTANAATPAQQKVLAMSEHIRQHLSAGQKHEANKFFLEQFDMVRFGKRCLQDYWGTLSASEQKRFTDLLFQNLLKAADEKNFLVQDEKTFRLIPQSEVKTDGVLAVKSQLATSRKTLSLRLFLFAEQGTYPEHPTTLFQGV